jgi:hypothetical protein
MFAVRLSVRIGAAVIGRIYITFDIVNLHEKSVETFQICLQSDKIVGQFEDPEYVVSLRASPNHHKVAVFG